MPTWACCGVRDKGGKRGHTRTPERARVWAHSGVRDEGKGEDGRKGGRRWCDGQRDHPDTKDATW